MNPLALRVETPCPSAAILGVRVDATHYADACARVAAWAAAGRSCYVIAANVHVVMSAHRDAAFREVVNGAALVTADGMPLVAGLRLLGHRGATRVYGPDLVLAWCREAARLELPLYLYGGTSAVLSRLRERLVAVAPGLRIAGCHAPPFRELTEAESRADIERIVASGARVVLVGLGCPKQERWMARQCGRLPAVMLGVGAAFDFHAGTVAQAPRWMMACGLEWMHRLAMEPRRLWRRYLFTNPAFVLAFGLQLLRRRRH